MHLEYSVANVGSGIAFDVRATFDPPLKAFQDDADDKEQELPFQEVVMLPPGSRLTSFLGNYQSYKDASHLATVSWSRKPGSKRRESISYTLNLAHLQNKHGLGRGDPLISLARSVEEIRKKGLRVTGRKRELQVSVFNREDREQDRESRDKAIKDQMKRLEGDS